MLPRGFLGTRADLLMDVVFVSTLATPFILVWAIRLAQQRQLEKHRFVQTLLLGVLLVAVALFEVDVRLSGGSGSLMKGSSYAGTGLLRGITLAHVLANVVTFIAWLVLVVKSRRRFNGALPGSFSASHRRLGRFVLGGTVFGALSAIVMYGLGFVA
jgi:hypothetical protein